MLQTTAEVVEGEEKGGFGLQPGLQRACGVDTDLGETHPASSPGKDTWDCTVVVKPNMFVCIFCHFLVHRLCEAFLCHCVFFPYVQLPLSTFQDIPIVF